MDDSIRRRDAQPDSTPYQCNQTPSIAYELNQSILIIHSYISGGSERLKDILRDVDDHVDLVSNKAKLII